jgi:hypothetical protein
MHGVIVRLVNANYALSFRSLSRISLSVGKRPSSFLEKSFSSPTLTTKMPPLPRTRSLSRPRDCLMVAARLEALGR